MSKWLIGNLFRIRVGILSSMALSLPLDALRCNIGRFANRKQALKNADGVKTAPMPKLEFAAELFYHITEVEEPLRQEEKSAESSTDENG